MSLLVVGSVAYDSVQTDAGSRRMALGGSAVYFSLAASYLADVSLVGVVGEDFKQRHVDLLTEHGVDVSGLERSEGKTFHWSGVYSTEDVNTRETLDTQLNVFSDFSPTLADGHRSSDYVFLANIDPELQMRVIDQMERRPKVVALDSMNFWIDGRRSELDEVVGRVDILFLDEGEAKSYSGETNLVKAARRIQEMGPRVAVVKRGEHGALVFDRDEVFAAPAMPLERAWSTRRERGTRSPAGSWERSRPPGTCRTGDCGGRRWVGSMMGSFAVQDFSVGGLMHLKRKHLRERFQEFVRLTAFDDFQF